MELDQEVVLMLGRVQGTLEQVVATQEVHSKMLQGVDDRLRTVEQKTAVAGAVGGGLAALAVGVGVDFVKARLGVA